ncbi:DUF2972 domain-containing protein [Campylobacter hepaticus]|uniref:DUF2972 domain-containing protein n=1 Tax=Campylobacter hepaticus TaxID=1813019 RepID=A0A6A7JRX6_9BACT|nr:DUF2972 domain-containing protein [Campylobacter hepaticus]MPV53721.1 DUF2972 domain-containing protein [Campylobacter hepaticus]MPV61804.1 DUF2972 domain-containing protein [Campylobacter hepaticus]MPV77534.1 DUF2972 domain-containing protein [Campylobacter hepaticus]MPV78376.1 DUF2972 domain-containing protein [Campylobacter hepaticus]
MKTNHFLINFLIFLKIIFFHLKQYRNDILSSWKYYQKFIKIYEKSKNI